MADIPQVCSTLDEMTASMASVRELIQSLRDKQASSDATNMTDGISLLSWKHHLMLSYIQSLVLLCARRAIGDPMEDRTPPSNPFSTTDRDPRGSGIGDLVDSMIEGRVVLEKIRVMESRMRYQIEKLVRIADESPKAVTEDPLAFRPNPQNLVNNEQLDGGLGEDTDEKAQEDGVYRPPKLAPMPYVETTSDKRSKRQPVPKTLSSLIHQDPSRPHVESTSGLSFTPALASDRAREIQQMTEFEEDNFTRLVMKRKDARRRKRDEEDLALGGSGMSKGRRRGRGLEDEFEDILRSVGRTKTGSIGDGYEELRQKGKKSDALSRSRTRTRDDDESDGREAPQAKRTRFERERRTLNKKIASVRAKSKQRS
ncbi:hypothetical protein PISMIDRAFT_685745 [Pisolithus microcarpus 441]|uniref:Neuroguidin n=1 Tax=Pisolithus microcarpus 441 TaxID=765257 RepID=A0A0C9YSS5_9AGAM|nr:hypothetical protein BKA83DRAFT_4169660 [Pisolithus microcarpus]KIK17004.1 hypothetical protein PISMIDRAFT_685745 [Pisolithus microcarpus 441]